MLLRKIRILILAAFLSALFYWPGSDGAYAFDPAPDCDSRLSKIWSGVVSQERLVGTSEASLAGAKDMERQAQDAWVTGKCFLKENETGEGCKNIASQREWAKWQQEALEPMLRDAKKTYMEAMQKVERVKRECGQAPRQADSDAKAEKAKTEATLAATSTRYLAPQSAFVAPTGDPQLTEQQLAADMQTALKNIGCYTKSIDGDWGSGSRAALQRFNSMAGTNFATDVPMQEALAAVSSWGGGKCKVVAKRKTPRKTRKAKTYRKKKTTTSSRKTSPSGGGGSISIGIGGGGIAISDTRLKRDVMHIATLESGIKLYRFRYLWEETQRVGVMAQELLVLDATHGVVTMKPGGYYAVDYQMLGLRMTTFEAWREKGLDSVLLKSSHDHASVIPAAFAE
jgi:hypothetical protein